MNLQRVGASLFAVIAVVSILLAGGHHLAVPDQPGHRSRTPSTKAMSRRWSEVSPEVLYQALSGLLKYL
jgi:hypothetical protein